MDHREVPAHSQPRPGWLTVAVVTVMVGITAGIGGMLLGLLLHLIQHLAYGYSLHELVGHESFLQGVSGASPTRRVLVLSGCGFVAGLGWWALFRFGKPLVSIAKAVVIDGPRMPLRTTFVHDLLQIVTVALGSPLGREVAPREVGAAVATQLSIRAGLTPETRRIMIACGAGAGLAAVYNVPLSGALFTLEVLLGTFSFSVLVPALATSVIAAMVAWIGLGNAPLYSLPHLAISTSLVVWSIVMGPLFGFAAYWFVRVTKAARSQAPRDWQLPLLCIAVFPIIGLLAVTYPQLLGNGRGLAQAGFDNELGLTLAAVLLPLRVLVTVGALRAGAQGGLLTPSLAIGGAMATVSGGLWSLMWPSASLGAFAVVGSAAFLASSNAMPLTAIVLILELTRVGQDFLVPILLAVAGSISIYSLCDGRSILFARKPGAINAHSLQPEKTPALPEDNVEPQPLEK